jgi:hypothetical protein
MEEQACSWGVKALQLHSTATGKAFFAQRGYTDAGKVRSPYGVETVFFWKQLDEEATCPNAPKRKRFCNCNTAYRPSAMPRAAPAPRPPRHPAQITSARPGEARPLFVGGQRLGGDHGDAVVRWLWRLKSMLSSQSTRCATENG